MRHPTSRGRLGRAQRPCAALRARLGGDRGDASIEMAIILPIVIMLSLLAAQACMWYYAREVAQSAAREGVTAGRTYKTPLRDGTARAAQVAHQLGGNSLLDVGVSSGGSTADRVTITVTGHAPSVIPLLSGPSITQTASGPRENWTRP